MVSKADSPARRSIVQPHPPASAGSGLQTQAAGDQNAAKSRQTDTSNRLAELLALF